MEHIAPLGPIYQAGTLSGNPVAMAAGLTTLNMVSQPGFYDALIKKTEKLVSGLEQRAEKTGIPLTTNQAGAMFGFFFSDEKNISNFAQVGRCDAERFKKFYHGMLDHGVYLAPSAYEAGFVSSAHTEEHIEITLDAAEKVFKTL
jgi:glutamate-1-semialdehyde 2,1-aminomutase